MMDAVFTQQDNRNRNILDGQKLGKRVSCTLTNHNGYRKEKIK